MTAFPPPRPPAVLSELLAATARLGFDQSCSHETGALLRALAAAKPGGRCLNLGTGVGVSCAWLLDGMDTSAELVTVDIDPAVSAEAQRALGGRATVVVEDAATWLRRASADGERFDLVFADAVSGKYSERAHALDLVAAGGFYVVDDLHAGPDAEAPWRMPGDLIAALAADARFVVITLDWDTGHAVAVRR
jgi:predicted O-methyltransferase YrrM